MAYDHLAKLDVEGLQGYFSDFHKDFYGTRPRFATPEQWRDRAWLESQINAIHDAMDAMKKTFSGREQLRSEGWVVDEAEFADIVDLMEYAEWCADADAEFLGRMHSRYAGEPT
jgi:hypothetical protein